MNRARLFPVQVNGKTGFIDASGKIVIEPTMDGAYDFSEGLAAAYIARKQLDEGYIDEEGNVAIPAKFNITGGFHEGMAWAGLDPNRKPYKLGPLTLFTGPPSDSFDYKIGFINRSGDWIVKPIYTFARDFSEGLAAVRSRDGKFGFIDPSGKYVIAPRFTWASCFSEGLAAVFQNGHYGYHWGC